MKSGGGRYQEEKAGLRPGPLPPFPLLVPFGLGRGSGLKGQGNRSSMNRAVGNLIKWARE